MPLFFILNGVLLGENKKVLSYNNVFTIFNIYLMKSRGPQAGSCQFVGVFRNHPMIFSFFPNHSMVLSLSTEPPGHFPYLSSDPRHTACVKVADAHQSDPDTELVWFCRVLLTYLWTALIAASRLSFWHVSCLPNQTIRSSSPEHVPHSFLKPAGTVTTLL